MTRKKRTSKNKDAQFIKLGEGYYADQDDPSITLLDPVEMLESLDLELTNVAVIAVYAEAMKLAEEAGLELVLITHDHKRTHIDEVKASLKDDSTPVDIDGKYTGPERRKFKRAT